MQSVSVVTTAPGHAALARLAEGPQAASLDLALKDVCHRRARRGPARKGGRVRGHGEGRGSGVRVCAAEVWPSGRERLRKAEDTLRDLFKARDLCLI